MLKSYIADNLIRWEQKKAPPTQLSISITNTCNLGCLSCWQRDRSHQSGIKMFSAEMPDQNILDIIKEASDFGVRCIEITGGGEPLARRNLVLQVVKEIKKKA